MAPIDHERAADQTQSVIAAGLKAVCPAPLVYLHDMAVTVEPSPDGRTVSVTVLANDADEHGERPPVYGAIVQVIAHGKPVAETKTDAYGTCGLPLPVGEDPANLVLRVEHESYNPRHLRLDGTNVVEDIRQRLYGGA